MCRHVPYSISFNLHIPMRERVPPPHFTDHKPEDQRSQFSNLPKVAPLVKGRWRLPAALCPGAEPTLPGQACYPSRPFSAGFSLCCKWNSLLRYSGREATEHFLQTVLSHLSSETDHPLWLSAFLLLRVGKNPGGQDAIQRALLSPPLHVLGEFPVPAPLGCR